MNPKNMNTEYLGLRTADSSLLAQSLPVDLNQGCFVELEDRIIQLESLITQSSAFGRCNLFFFFL